MVAIDTMPIADPYKPVIFHWTEVFNNEVAVLVHLGGLRGNVASFCLNGILYDRVCKMAIKQALLGVQGAWMMLNRFTRWLTILWDSLSSVRSVRGHHVGVVSPHWFHRTTAVLNNVRDRYRIVVDGVLCWVSRGVATILWQALIAGVSRVGPFEGLLCCVKEMSLIALKSYPAWLFSLPSGARWMIVLHYIKSLGLV